jgi:hypothetical protein
VEKETDLGVISEECLLISSVGLHKSSEVRVFYECLVRVYGGSEASEVVMADRGAEDLLFVEPRGCNSSCCRIEAS